MRQRAVVVGSVNADLVVRTDRAPDRGETLDGSDFQIYPGGKGANQAVALGRLGTPVSFVGLTGRDSYAELARTALTEAGVDLSGLGETHVTTGVALITTERSGDNRIVVVPGANGCVTAEYVEQHRECIEAAGVLLLQLELPLPAVIRAAEIARAAGAIVVLDPAPARELPHELLSLVTWLTPNETEARVLLGTTEERNADATDALADAVRKLGVQNVVLKCGANGCVVSCADRSLSRPAFRVDAVDTTAAGDAFNAGFGSALLDDLPLESVIRRASAAAALSVSRRGAIPSLPMRDEVEQFLQTTDTLS